MMKQRAPMKPWLPALLYAVAIVPMALMSHWTADAAFGIYEKHPNSIHSAKLSYLLLNEVAPFLGGVALAVACILLLERLHVFLATARWHVYRALPWYVFAAVLSIIVMVNEGDHHFDLWSQIVTWPRAALVGAIITDLLWTWHRVRRQDELTGSDRKNALPSSQRLKAGSSRD